MRLRVLILLYALFCILFLFLVGRIEGYEITINTGNTKSFMVVALESSLLSVIDHRGIGIYSLHQGFETLCASQLGLNGLFFFQFWTKSRITLELQIL